MGDQGQAMRDQGHGGGVTKMPREVCKIPMRLDHERADFYQLPKFVREK